MGTQYKDDGGLGDFIVGQATGAGYNFHSWLGAQYRTPPYSPPNPLCRRVRSEMHIR